MELVNLFDSIQNKNILVAGASGFIGTNLSMKLLKLGAKVRGVICKNELRIQNDNLSWVRGNLMDENFCNKAVQNIDYVFMCAGNTAGASVIEKNPLAHVTPNLIMNSLMLQAACNAGVEKFIFISSSTVYPDLPKPMAESDMQFDFFDKYYFMGWTNAFSEILCRMHGEKLKTMSTIVIRPSDAYGPYDNYEWETSHVLPSLIRKVVEGHNPIEVWGNGHDVRNFIFIDDLTEGIIKCANDLNGFEIINLASEKSHSIIDALKTILNITKKKNVEIVLNSSKPTTIASRFLDITKAKTLIDFCPSITFEDGIKRTVDWMKRDLQL